MSLDEVKERIKAEVVLREGDLFEWQWRQMGLMAEAEASGIPAGEFLNLVNEVSRAINPYFGRISDLKIRVADLGRLNRKKLTSAQIGQLVAEAERLQLAPDFVKDRWIPAILDTIPNPVEPTGEPLIVVPTVTPPIVTPPAIPGSTQPAPRPATPPAQSGPTPTSSAVPPVSVSPPMFAAGTDRDAVARKVHQFLDEYAADKHIPVRVLKPLFLATNFDENVLADAVLGYLSANFYAAETPVHGETLKARLLSTDWRHLSWWEATPVDPAVLDAAVQPALPARRKTSDSGIIAMAMVAVGLLIGGVWWATVGKPTPPVRPPTSVKPADSVQSTRPKKKPRPKPRRQKRPATNRPGTQTAPA